MFTTCKLCPNLTPKKLRPNTRVSPNVVIYSMALSLGPNKQSPSKDIYAKKKFNQNEKKINVKIEDHLVILIYQIYQIYQ